MGWLANGWLAGWLTHLAKWNIDEAIGPFLGDVPWFKSLNMVIDSVTMLNFQRVNEIRILRNTTCSKHCGPRTPPFCWECLDTACPPRNSTFSPSGLAFDASYASESTCQFMFFMHKSNQQPQQWQRHPLGGCRYPKKYHQVESIGSTPKLRELWTTRQLDLLSHLLAARVGTCLWQFPQVAVSHTIFDLALKPNASGHWELAGCRSGHKMAVKPWYPSYPEIVGLWMFIHQTMASVGFDRQIFSWSVPETLAVPQCVTHLQPASGWARGVPETCWSLGANRANTNETFKLDQLMGMLIPSLDWKLVSYRIFLRRLICWRIT